LGIGIFEGITKGAAGNEDFVFEFAEMFGGFLELDENFVRPAAISLLALPGTISTLSSNTGSDIL